MTSETNGNCPEGCCKIDKTRYRKKVRVQKEEKSEQQNFVREKYRRGICVEIDQKEIKNLSKLKVSSGNSWAFVITVQSLHFFSSSISSTMRISQRSNLATVGEMSFA